MSPNQDVEIRQARHADYDAVTAFTTNTWPDHDDYIPRVYPEWVDTDGDRQRTLVATLDDTPVGLVQGVLLTDDEAWAQGMRVHSDHRGKAISRQLSDAVFTWAATQGATVCRNMVFSWNNAGLGQSRAVGFSPLAAFRWLTPTPAQDADPTLEVSADPAIAWRVYHGSDADHTLAGLGLDLTESWAMAELTKQRLAAADTVIVVTDTDTDTGTGTTTTTARARGMTYRTRTFDRDTDDATTERWAEYGVAAWEDPEALRALTAAIARDAAAHNADNTRVAIPETPRHISDAAYARIPTADQPDFILERDLTRNPPP